MGRSVHFAKKPFSILTRLSLVIFLNIGCHPPAAYAAQDISAVWANDGEDKVTRDDLRASKGKKVTNTIWDGTKVSIFGGRNEVVAFNVILEAGSRAASNVKVTFNSMTGPNGSTITSKSATGDGVFNWVGRNIELFYVRYLPIHGLSVVANPVYDERATPIRMRRPWTGLIQAIGIGGWTNRPDHDKYYPEIAVPLELVPTFNISAASNQSIWVDVYIPKTATSGTYLGNFTVQEGGTLAANIPVQLKVYDFTLPDVPNAKTMLYYSVGNVKHRYLGNSDINPNTTAFTKAEQVIDRHYQLAHRHKISLIGDSPGDCGSSANQPCPASVPRLNGNTFEPGNGYDGPGVGTGNNVYSIGTYGSWTWSTGTEADMDTHTDGWVDWFTQNASNTDYFLYLIDEDLTGLKAEKWATWILRNPGSGKNMRSFATLPLPTAATVAPDLDIPASTLNQGIQSLWQGLADRYTNDSRKKFYMYNGHRPVSGSFVTEDDGVALREVAWGQFKKHIDRWFYWESTYYNNNQGGMGETNVFQKTQTFGGAAHTDASLGLTGWNYGNGDGVLFYPGTDTVFPSDSYNIAGPIASLRLKYWRRGIQDVDYLTMATSIDPSKVATIMSTVLPKALWELGVTSLLDPTYLDADITWSTDPDVWESARAQLAAMIAGTSSTTPPPPPPPTTPPPTTPPPTTPPPTTPPSTPVSLPPPTLRLPAQLSTDGAISAGYPKGYSIARFEWSFLPTTPEAAASSPIKAAAASVGTQATYPTPSATAQLGSLNISPGFYRISVVAVDTANNVSPPGQAYTTLVSPATAGPIRVYPNPWRADQSYGRKVTFDQMTANSTVTIFTISGHEVQKLTATGTSVIWDLATSSGDPVASGVYIYLVKTSDGATTRGKLAIVR